MSNEKNPGCLGYIGDYTTQLCRDYNKPLQGSLLNNQHNGKTECFFVAHMEPKHHPIETEHNLPNLHFWVPC